MIHFSLVYFGERQVQYNILYSAQLRYWWTELKLTAL